MSFTSLRWEKVGRIATATIATPDNLNGITEARLAVIEDVLADCETNEGIGVLVLTRKGRIFFVRLDLGLIQKAFADLDYFVSIVQCMNRLTCAPEM